MKRILLLALTVLLLLQGVCLAKIEKSVDEFDGSYGYYVDDYRSENNGRVFITSTFNLAFSSNDTIGCPNLIIDFKDEQAYYIDKTVNIKIDNTIYTWDTIFSSTRSYHSVNICLNLPSNVYEALMKTKQDVVVRFNYHALDGNYQKDYTLPYKTIQEVQTMYKTYYKPQTPQVAQ